MFEHYLRVVESFKVHKISILLLTIREKMVEALNSHYFNEKIRNYLSDMEVCRFHLMPEQPTLDNLPINTNAAYILTAGNDLYYYHMNNNSLVKLDLQPEQITALKNELAIDNVVLDEETSIEIFSNLSRAQKDIITRITTHVHEEIEPFDNFKHQPKQIVQIKEIINALYHGQLAFADLETVDLRSWGSRRKDLSLLYHNTIKHGYRASYLATHLDLDFTEAFSKEITTILSLFAAIQKYADNYSEDAAEIAQIIKDYPVSYQAGAVCGIAVDQLQPNTGTIDFNFLTELSAALPSYIQQLTAYIHQYSSCITELEPTLDRKKIEALQDDAFTLLNSINSIQDNNALLTFKVIHYIGILRHLTTLSSSILEQMGHMTETSQDVIRDKLSLIKYHYLPELFALVDKIEDEILLTPGTLSNPLKAQIIPFYQELIRYASKPVDFSVKGEELLTIEDSRFIELRLEKTEQRISQANQHLFKAEHIKKAFDHFFRILEKPQYADNRIIELSELTKKALSYNYRYLQPYLKKLDLELNNEIILGLTQTTGKYDTLRNVYNRWYHKPKSTDLIANILTHKTHLLRLIESEIVTQEFHKELNEDIIHNVYRDAQLTLHPYAPENTSLEFDEVKLLELMKPHDDHLEMLSQESEEEVLEKQKKLEQFFSELTVYKKLTEGLVPAPHFVIESERDRLISCYQELHPLLEKLNYLHKPLPDDRSSAHIDAVIHKHMDRSLSKITDIEGVAQSALNLYQSLLEKYQLAKIEASKNTEPLATILPEENKTILNNPALLSCDSALGLYSYYEVRHAKINRAIKAFTDFLKILQENKPEPLETLENTTKEKLKKSYLIFQPYFVNIFSKDQGIKLLDKSIIKCLQLDVTQKPAFSITVNRFIKLKPLFESRLLSTLEFTKSRRDIFYNVAQEKHVSETQLIPLLPDYSHGNRAHHLLKHTEFSKAVREFRTSLFQYVRFFNLSLRNKLTRASSGLPFPELEDPDKVLAQGKQVIGIKRLFNGLYHLEEICKQLEKLTDNSSQSVYVTHLIRAYSHINDIMNLAKEFYADPYMNLIAKEILLKAKLVQQTILEQSKPYLADAAPVTEVSGDVRLNALWYPLQAFMLIPEHIQSLYRKTPLSPEELHALQITSKRTAVNIERIIDSSSSYFKLLLQTPNMYRLFKELRHKLTLFTNTSHEAAMTHLNELNTEIFAQILIETDRWEDKIGLNPGQLSNYMKGILDEFYKGLLDPLGLVSQEHLKYVTNLDVFDQRKIANNERAVLAQHNLEGQSIKNNLDKLNILTDGFIIENFEDNLLTTYKKLHPLLEELKHLCKPLPTDNSFQACDNFIHGKIDPSWTKITNIPAVVNTAIHYYQGLQAGYQIEIDTALEKNTYLDKLRKEQILLNNKFLLDYTHKIFDKRVAMLISRLTDLTHVKSEYNQNLEVYLLKFKDEITTQSLPSTDIKESIKNLLHEKVKQFEDEHLPKYAQLNNILAAIVEFRRYYDHAHITLKNNSSIYESDQTLTTKNARYDALEKLCRDLNLPVEKRIEEIHKIVSTASFRVDIFARKNLETFSFAWIKRCFLSLLSALHLYTPAHEKNHEIILDAASPNPQLKNNRRQYGFFAEVERNYQFPTPFGLKVEEPDTSGSGLNAI